LIDSLHGIGCNASTGAASEIEAAKIIDDQLRGKIKREKSTMTRAAGVRIHSVIAATFKIREEIDGNPMCNVVVKAKYGQLQENAQEQNRIRNPKSMLLNNNNRKLA
jgi:hypothetical protein